jgi:hypothetical protein
MSGAIAPNASNLGLHCNLGSNVRKVWQAGLSRQTRLELLSRNYHISQMSAFQSKQTLRRPFQRSAKPRTISCWPFFSPRWFALVSRLSYERCTKSLSYSVPNRLDALRFGEGKRHGTSVATGSFLPWVSPSWSPASGSEPSPRWSFRAQNCWRQFEHEMRDALACARAEVAT